MRLLLLSAVLAVLGPTGYLPAEEKAQQEDAGARKEKDPYGRTMRF